MRLIIDMDYVLADNMTPWLGAYNKEYNDNLSVEDIDTWALHDLTKPDCGEKIYDYIHEPGFFRYLKPLPNSLEVMEKLFKEGHEIIIATAVPKGATTGYYDKRMWVEEHLPFLDYQNVIASHKKHVISGGLMFDDGPHNLEAFEGKTCAMDARWNKRVKTDFRVNNWLAFYEIVQSLRGKNE